jgi:hypothetical protein
MREERGGRREEGGEEEGGGRREEEGRWRGGKKNEGGGRAKEGRGRRDQVSLQIRGVFFALLACLFMFISCAVHLPLTIFWDYSCYDLMDPNKGLEGTVVSVMNFTNTACRGSGWEGRGAGRGGRGAGSRRLGRGAGGSQGGRVAELGAGVGGPQGGGSRAGRVVELGVEWGLAGLRSHGPIPIQPVFTKLGMAAFLLRLLFTNAKFFPEPLFCSCSISRDK